MKREEVKDNLSVTLDQDNTLQLEGNGLSMREWEKAIGGYVARWLGYLKYQGNWHHPIHTAGESYR